MEQKINNIAKNTSYFTLALILQKIIAFLYFIILARNLVPYQLGQYYLAISLTTIFSIFIDLGLANVLIRETAKYKDRASDFLNNIIIVKLPLALLSIVGVVITVNILNYPPIVKQLVYLSCIPMILDSFTMTFYGIMRGFHNLKYESIGAICYQLIILIIGTIALKLGANIKILMIILVAASFFNFIYSLSLIIFKWKLNLSFSVNRVLIKELILITLPFAIYGILQRLYTYLDTVFLSLFAGDQYVGLYQVSFKFIVAIQFIPMAFVASLYPAFSYYWQYNKSQLNISFERAINYLLIISLPISIGIITLSSQILKIFKPEYLAAKPPLQIICSSIIFVFLGYPIGALLNACDKQKVNTINMAITLLTSIILNLLLIPRFFAVGASITVFITSILMFILGFCQIPKIIKLRPQKLLLIFIKVFFASFLMTLLILFLRNNLNIILVIIISGLCYFAFLYLFKGFTREDVVSIINTFRKNKIQYK